PPAPEAPRLTITPSARADPATSGTPAASAAPSQREPQQPKVAIARAPKSKLDVEARYQGVLGLFDEFGVEVLRPPEEAHHEGPGFYIARIIPGEGVKTSSIERLKDELKLKLGLEATQEPRSYIDRGAVVFEIPKRDEERYFVDTRALMERVSWPPDALYAPIGEDINGDLVGVDFSSSDSPHLLIAGTTGSGKSIALESILFSLVESKTPAELELFIVDPKGTELGEFEHYEHQRGVIGFDGEDAIEILEQSVAEMQARLKMFKKRRVRSLPEYNEGVEPQARIPWRLIVLDEYADLISDKDERKEIEKLLQRLAQKARSSGIHIILATQKPSAEVLSTVVRSNLPAQLARRV
ncbi:MAG: FtsK/SpoIIIE domain-containing protein, partial [Myxococcota bacterium]|nr:FtsK/SpoIIIE domain-containing protein [Myxococcota bacterium]